MALNFIRCVLRIVVDVHPVRLVVRDGDVGPELAQNAGVVCKRRRRDIGRRCTQFFERHFSRKTCLREFHITAKTYPAVPIFPARGRISRDQRRSSLRRLDRE